MEKGLPKRIIIAAWWMILTGLFFFLKSLSVFIEWYNNGIYLNDPSDFGVQCFITDLLMITIPSTIGIVFLFLPGVFLLLRKKWSLWFATISLLIGCLIGAFGILLISPLFSGASTIGLGTFGTYHSKYVGIYIFIFLLILTIPLLLLINVNNKKIS
jgi:hypothetical protein